MRIQEKPYPRFLSPAGPVSSVLLGGALLAAMPCVTAAADAKPVAGKADVLRHIPKKFATLLSVDADKRVVNLKLEGEEQSKSWNVPPDAELKIYGWWGRLEQFRHGDRVWVWFAIDRKKQPRSILVLTDETSQQDINGLPHVVTAFDAPTNMITVKSKVSGQRRLKAPPLESAPRIDGKVYVQTSGAAARIIATREGFEKLRDQQRQWVRGRWREEGLPGAVTFAHPLSGEMEVMLDHEAIRWGRFLKTGDAVALSADGEIKATVKHVRPWRERTLVRLVTASGVDQVDLTIGQPILARVPEPPEQVQQSSLPTDIGRLTAKSERIDWFLASVYCPCKVAGNRCTGMFYTLASCNVNACGMPNSVRKQVGEMIDKGLTDEQIWSELHTRRGPDLIRQHLLP